LNNSVSAAQGMFDTFNFASLLNLGYLFQYAFWAMGILSVGYGIFKLMEATAPGKQEGFKGMLALLIGGLMMSAGPLIATLSESMLTSGVSNQTYDRIAAFAYFAPQDAGASAASQGYQALYGTVLNLAVLFGYWSVGKGLLLLKKTSDGAAQHLDEGAMSGATHIMFGVGLVNIREVLTMTMVNILGFNSVLVENLTR